MSKIHHAAQVYEHPRSHLLRSCYGHFLFIGNFKVTAWGRLIPVLTWWCFCDSVKWFAQFGVKNLYLPAQTYDLNHIHHLWDKLELELWTRSNQPRSACDFTNPSVAKSLRFRNNVDSWRCNFCSSGVHLLLAMWYISSVNGISSNDLGNDHTERKQLNLWTQA